MRRILLPLVALLAFTCVASAASGERTVSRTVTITATGFSPESVTIRSVKLVDRDVEERGHDRAPGRLRYRALQVEQAPARK